MSLSFYLGRATFTDLGTNAIGRRTRFAGGCSSTRVSSERGASVGTSCLADGASGTTTATLGGSASSASSATIAASCCA